MTFTDPQLQQCYARNFIGIIGLSNELNQVCTLLAVHSVFHMLEGPHSARVHETVDQLLSPALRPALREWYQRPGVKMDGASMQFRDQLNQLAGERLEDPEAVSFNPS
jgi:hypothetical protein